jgi:hypothetical protein
MKEKMRSTAGLGLGIAGMTMGILAMIFGILGSSLIGPLIFGILGITFSSIAFSQARLANAQTGLIIAAFIVSILGIGALIIQLTNSDPKNKNLIRRIHHTNYSPGIIEGPNGENLGDNFGIDTVSMVDLLDSLENENVDK